MGILTSDECLCGPYLVVLFVAGLDVCFGLVVAVAFGVCESDSQTRENGSDLGIGSGITELTQSPLVPHRHRCRNLQTPSRWAPYLHRTSRAILGGHEEN